MLLACTFIYKKNVSFLLLFQLIDMSTNAIASNNAAQNVPLPLDTTDTVSENVDTSPLNNPSLSVSRTAGEEGAVPPSSSFTPVSLPPIRASVLTNFNDLQRLLDELQETLQDETVKTQREAILNREDRQGSILSRLVDLRETTQTTASALGQNQASLTTEQQQLEGLRSEAVVNRASLAPVESEIAQTSTQLVLVTTEIEEATAEQQNLQQQQQTLSTQLEAFPDLTAEQNVLETEQQTITARLTEIEQELDTLEVTGTSLTALHEEQAALLTQQETIVGQLETNAQQQEQKAQQQALLQAVTLSLAENELSLTSLQNQQSGFRQQVDTLQAEEVQLQDQGDVLEQEINQSETRVTGLENTIAEQEITLATTGQEVATLAQQLEAIETVDISDEDAWLRQVSTEDATNQAIQQRRNAEEEVKAQEMLYARFLGRDDLGVSTGSLSPIQAILLNFIAPEERNVQEVIADALKTLEEQPSIDLPVSV